MCGFGGLVFVVQFGQVFGNFLFEVVLGGDVGILVLLVGIVVIILQNLIVFGEGLEIFEDQIVFYFVMCEFVYVCFYCYVKWLYLYVMVQIMDFVCGVIVDVDVLEDVVSCFDLFDFEELWVVIEGGVFLFVQSEVQCEVLIWLENFIVMIDGWVDVVIVEVILCFFDGVCIVEVVCCCCVVGGFVEDVLGVFVGLKLWLCCMCEVLVMWQVVIDVVGIGVCDVLWDYFDFMLMVEDIDDLSVLVVWLQVVECGEQLVVDEFDEVFVCFFDGDDFLDEKLLIDGDEDGDVVVFEGD